MQFGLISLFPDMFVSLNYGIVGRAIQKGLITINMYNPRDFTFDKHHQVDDRPYGGGAGMVMLAQPLQMAIQQAKNDIKNPATVVYLSPQGKTLTHEGVCELRTRQNLILLCGRYEGIDERVLVQDVDEEWSIGDYVLSGGEFAAMVIIDSITRLLPEALGHEGSAIEDSFATGLLDYPHYTRPETFNGHSVPNVLLSGNHDAIRRWRLKQALMKTWQQRPDLLDKLNLTAEQRNLLNEIQCNQGEK